MALKSSSYYKRIAVGKPQPTAKIASLAKQHNVKPGDFVNRKAYLNTIARYAGFKNYSQWQKARRAIGIPKHTGGRKSSSYKEIKVGKCINLVNMDDLNKSFKEINKFTKNSAFYSVKMISVSGKKSISTDFGLVEGDSKKALEYKIMNLLTSYGTDEKCKQIEKFVVNKSNITIQEVENAEDVY